MFFHKECSGGANSRFWIREGTPCCFFCQNKICIRMSKSTCHKCVHFKLNRRILHASQTPSNALQLIENTENCVGHYRRPHRILKPSMIPGSLSLRNREFTLSFLKQYFQTSGTKFLSNILLISLKTYLQ